MIGILAILLFVSLVLAGYALSLWAQQSLTAKQALSRRLEAMAGARPAQGGPILKDQRLSRIPMLDSFLRGVPLVIPMVRMIRQAGLRRRVGEVLLYVVLLASIALLLAILLGAGALIGLVVAGVAGAIPLFVVARMRAKRQALFAEQLPEALDLVRAALQAGHGLLSAIGVVAETFPEPISQELRYLVEEVRLGLPLRDALGNLHERTGDQNVPILAIGILTAQEVGGNLAEVIDNVAYTIRERAKLHRDVRVLTAQGRFSGTVLSSLPFLVATVMMLFNRDYFLPLVEERAGHYMIAYALISILLGHMVMRRIVRIEV